MSSAPLLARAQAAPEAPEGQDATQVHYGAAAAIDAPLRQTASEHRVGSRDLDAVPYRSAEDALKLVPGLTVVQHGSEGKGPQLFLRGFDAMHGSDLELRVEGVPLNEWSNVHAQGYLDLGFVIPEAIESVRVTKGPFRLEQGAFATAGSADYQLGIAPDNRGVRHQVTLGSTRRLRGVASYSPANADGHDFLMAEALHDDGFGPNRAIDRFALLGRTRLFESRRLGKLSLWGAGHGAAFGLPGTLRDDDRARGAVSFHGSYDPAGHGISGRSLLALAHEHRGAGHATRSTLYASYRHLELVENYTGFLYDPVNGDRREQLQSGLGFGAETQHELELARPLHLTVGAGLRGDVLEQAQQRLDLARRPLEAERELRLAQLLVHGLAGLVYRPVEGLRLSAGARLDVTHQRVDDALTEDARGAGSLVSVGPRLGVHYQPLPALGLFASYGRGFRPAEARAFSGSRPARVGLDSELYTGGSPGMTFANAVELGARWAPNRYLSTRLSAFGTFVDKESVFDHVSGINLELNATRRLGAELDVELRPLPWLTFAGDVTAVQARFVESQAEVPFAPPIAGGARAVLTHPSGWSAGLRMLALAPRPLPHGAQSAPYATLDASVGYRRAHWQASLVAENVLDLELREGEYHYASHWDPGREPSALPVTHYAAGPPLNVRLTVAATY